VVFILGVSVNQVVTLSIKGIVRAVYMTSYSDNLSHGSPAEVEQVPSFQLPRSGATDKEI
jgi:hypothetical protein